MRKHLYFLCISLLVGGLLFISNTDSYGQKRKPAKKAAKKKSSDGEEGESTKANSSPASPKYDGSGFNIKFAPGFLWNTAGLEVEFPVGAKLTLGVNAYGKLGPTDNKKNNYIQKQEDYMKTGYLAELSAKYYFGSAPVGMYAHITGGYGNLLYGDGTIKPYSMITRPRDFEKAPQVAIELPEVKPYRGSLGIGYQFAMPTRKLVANLAGGALVGFDSENKTFFSLYLAPSVGIIF